MKYINRLNFIKSFNLMKHAKHLKTKDVGRNCDLSPQYLYYLSSPKSTASKRVKISIIQEVARGLQLNNLQTKSWISTMNNTKNNQNIPKNKYDTSNKGHPVVSVKYIHVNINLQKMIRHSMSKRHLNVHQLASRSHLNHNYIYSLINGKVPYVSKITMIKIAKGLGMNVNIMVKPTSFNTINNNYLNKKNTRSKHNYQLIKNVRPSVYRTVKDMSKLNDADVNIIDLLINRLINTNK